VTSLRTLIVTDIIESTKHTQWVRPCHDQSLYSTANWASNDSTVLGPAPQPLLLYHHPIAPPEPKVLVDFYRVPRLDWSMVMHLGLDTNFRGFSRCSRNFAEFSRIFANFRKNVENFHIANFPIHPSRTNLPGYLGTKWSGIFKWLKFWTLLCSMPMQHYLFTSFQFQTWNSNVQDCLNPSRSPMPCPINILLVNSYPVYSLYLPEPSHGPKSKTGSCSYNQAGDSTQAQCTFSD
jgi:hypothetical protein